MLNEWQLRREICEIGRRVHERGLVAGTDGNVSARAGDGRFLITPSGSCLGRMNPDELVVIDVHGNPLTGRQARPSSERWMHLAAYAGRPELAAAIHAHPPTLIAFTLAGVELSPCALPEAVLAFGFVPVARYATPGTEEGAEAVRELIRRYDALVLDRHGSLTTGRNLWDAYYKLEKLEHAAQVQLMARQLGELRGLPPAEMAKLAALREHFGLGRAADVPAECLPPGGALPEIRTGSRSY